MEYAAWNMPVEPDWGGVAAGDDKTVSSFSNLFPDSLAYSFQYDIGDSTKNTKISSFASAGFTFDPYSFGYDRYKKKGLFRDSLGVGYGYRLDTLWTIMDYRMPFGYNPSSPDTLRFALSHYDIYTRNDRNVTYYNGYYGGDTNVRGIFPIVKYANPIPERGPYATSPKAPSTVFVDYILTPQDSAILEPGYRALRTLYVIPSGGYEVPAGSCLGVLVQYIPGYNYNLDDTLRVQTWNSQRPTNDQFVSESMQKNLFSIRNWNYDTSYMHYMFDAGGYNGSLHETMGVRYATDTTDWGAGAFYNGGYYGKPVFYVSLSVADDDTIHFSEWKESSAVRQIENLVSNIYPNPATTQLTVDLNNAGNTNMSIYNMLGQVVMEATLTEMSNKVNIADLSQGMYVVKVIQNGKTHTVKLSKK
jgi:hypothetical protein